MAQDSPKGHAHLVDPFFRNLRELTGGVVIERSRCCNAPMRKTGGIVIEVCSKCGKPNPPPPVLGA